LLDILQNNLDPYLAGVQSGNRFAKYNLTIAKPKASEVQIGDIASIGFQSLPAIRIVPRESPIFPQTFGWGKIEHSIEVRFYYQATTKLQNSGNNDVASALFLLGEGLTVAGVQCILSELPQWTAPSVGAGAGGAPAEPTGCYNVRVETINWDSVAESNQGSTFLFLATARLKVWQDVSNNYGVSL
jgi:hypothetical protein